MRTMKRASSRQALLYLSSFGTFALSSLGPVQAQTVGAAADGGELAEVVVTATRQAQSESKVPISLTALTEKDLDVLGAKQIDDIARFTPGLNFSRDSFAGLGNRSQISIRGIESGVGASTTGIYIDDTPIQTRNAGYTSTSVFPQVFDLTRIEVLRGPQGTLFGSGSEGGTVRFITPEPGLDKTTAYSRAEFSRTEDGGWGYEAGGAIGGPIIPGELAARASVFYRTTAGWIDRVDRLSGEMRDDNSNSSHAAVVRAAVTWVPVEGLKISPSVFYQDLRSNGGDGFWETLSDPDAGRFRSGNALASPSRDKFALPALKIEYDFGAAELVSNTSYLDRRALANPDYTQYVRSVTTGSPYPLLPGEGSRGDFIDEQKGLTEELRIQSSNPASRFNWVAGVFFNRTQQLDTEIIEDPTFPQMVLDTYGIDYLSLFGTPLGALNSVYTDEEHTTDKQVAIFGQVDYNVTDKLKATVGLRYAKVDFSFRSRNEGPYAGDATNSGSQSEHPLTPRFGLSYQFDDANLFYVSAAKGFRPGGAQRRPPSSCTSDLEALGIDSPPATYTSDSVWSYEVGAKSRLMQGRLQIAASAFWINWSDIQQTVNLVDCGQSFIGNLGKATSKGMDFAVDARIAEHWTVHASAGYTRATFSDTIISGSAFIAIAGDPTSTISPWTGNVYAQYSFNIGSHRGFALANYDFTSRGPAPDASLFGTDPALFQRPATKFVTGRLGMDFGNLTTALFVDNLLDSHPTLSKVRDIPSSPLFTLATFRPRTVGVTLTYSY